MRDLEREREMDLEREKEHRGKREEAEQRERELGGKMEQRASLLSEKIVEGGRAEMS